MPINAATIAQMEMEPGGSQGSAFAGRWQALPDPHAGDFRGGKRAHSGQPHGPARAHLVRPRAARIGAGRGAARKSGGDLVCSLCGKTGLTELGLKLHTARIHKGRESQGGRTSVGFLDVGSPPGNSGGFPNGVLGRRSAGGRGGWPRRNRSSARDAGARCTSRSRSGGRSPFRCACSASGAAG